MEQNNGTLRPSALSTVTNDDGSVTSSQCNADFGLGDADAAGHIATLHDCSCQFPSVFGLPCRHVLHLHTQQQTTTLQYECAKRWATRLPEVDLRNLRSLRALPIPSAQPALRNASAPTFADRRSLLLDEFLPILDAAARNADAFHALRSSMPAINPFPATGDLNARPSKPSIPAAAVEIPPVTARTHPLVPRDRQSTESRALSGNVSRNHSLRGLSAA